MATVNVLDINGQKIGKVTLPAELFEVKANPGLLAQAVRVYLSNQRQGTAKTKTRSEVDLTTKKWYRQKGTGNARHGAQSAPLFVGGGISHGPNGLQDYSLSMSRRMRQKALACALSQKFSENKVIVVDGINNIESKTRQAAEVLEKLEIGKDKSSLIVGQPSKNLSQAWGNLAQSTLMQAHMLNAYLLLKGGILVIEKDTISQLGKIYLESNQAVNKVAKVEKFSAKVEKKTEVVKKIKAEKIEAKTAKKTSVKKEVKEVDKKTIKKSK